MARVYTENYGTSPPFKNATLAKGVAVPRSSLAAALAGVAGGGDLKASLFLTGEPDESSHPATAVLHEAGLIYPPRACFVRTLKHGMNIEGLRGPPINRVLQRCSDRWKCDSVGLTNNFVYEGREACEAGCVVQPGSVKGRCYQPYAPEGACTNAARSCGCSQEGHAFCLDSGVTRMEATGTCRCVPDQWCETEPINASLPFSFDDLPTPVGDVTIYVQASMPYPFDQQMWLRLRLAEGDMRTLGYVFGAPDCSSSDCRLPFTLNDATTPLIDHIRIPMADARRLFSDGTLEFAVEIDAPRPDLSCGLHWDHERCFPGLSQAEMVARVYKYQGQTELAAALDASSTTFSVASASAAGIAAGEYIRVDDELMLVSSVATNALTVVRGAAGSSAAAHVLGTCLCADHTTACETAATYAACDAATPAQVGTLPVPVPWTPNSVRVVDPVILPGLFNQGGEVTLRAITISYATA
uniref:Uncharacterized protein n=1 Tax=Hemiselmis andersenii TaxID=464988 RepID=A0A7S1MW82_HEMAN